MLLNLSSTTGSTPSTTATRTISSRKARVLLATGQGLLAAIFLFAGGSKLLMSAAALAENSDLPAMFLRFIGVCEVLGALGLILPGHLRIPSVLISLAATGLVLIMAGAVVVTVATMGVAPALFPLAVGLVAATVAVMRRPATITLAQRRTSAGQRA